MLVRMGIEDEFKAAAGRILEEQERAREAAAADERARKAAEPDPYLVRMQALERSKHIRHFVDKMKKRGSPGLTTIRFTSPWVSPFERNAWILLNPPDGRKGWQTAIAEDSVVYQGLGNIVTGGPYSYKDEPSDPGQVSINQLVETMLRHGVQP
jgi:hypothetical protein